MRGRILSILLASGGLPGLANAQALAYRDVLRAEHEAGPRLAYQPMTIGGAPIAPAAAAPGPEEAEGPVRSFYFDRIEYHAQPGGDGWSWDVSAEFGFQNNRLWLSTAGDASPRGTLQYVEGQALYSRPVLDAGLALQAGIRQDFVRPRRTYAVLGAQGNITEPLYVGLFGFLSNRRELTARAFAYYDWELVPRVVVQPYAGVEAAARDIPALGLGHGLTSAELGLRVRYRIAEPFAPYVGVSWDRLLGRTARLARLAGDEPGSTSLVIGLRSYF